MNILEMIYKCIAEEEKRKMYNEEISITDDKAWYYLDPQN